MRVPAITFGLIVALVLAFGAVWFTGCAPRVPPHRLICVQSGADTVAIDEDGSPRRVIVYDCEES